ncbi:hypothetical protein [Nocardia fusca]|uniref:hypothetical protein n=1 Tax=Nocardia fusca TaxID=941183 RepID=UPI0007A76559|nr:hypothetical protein [Nocardia fusca]
MTDHVHHGVRQAGWDGVVLPETKVSDYTVYPVVAIDTQVWADRTTAGQRPELDRSLAESDVADVLDIRHR